MPENREILATINKYIAKYRNVRYLGYLPPEKLYREVARHHVLIYPSCRDAFTLTVLEALALGLGIVAYNVSLSFIILANQTENPTLLKLALDSFKVKWLERKSLITLKLFKNILPCFHLCGKESCMTKSYILTILVNIW